MSVTWRCFVFGIENSCPNLLWSLHIDPRITVPGNSYHWIAHNLLLNYAVNLSVEPWLLIMKYEMWNVMGTIIRYFGSLWICKREYSDLAQVLLNFTTIHRSKCRVQGPVKLKIWHRNSKSTVFFLIFVRLMLYRIELLYMTQKCASMMVIT